MHVIPTFKLWVIRDSVCIWNESTKHYLHYVKQKLKKKATTHAFYLINKIFIMFWNQILEPESQQNSFKPLSLFLTTPPPNKI